MNFKRPFCVMTTVALFSIAAAAQSVAASDSNTVLSLDTVLDTVLSNNPALGAAYSKWEAARERVPQARAWADPRFGFDQRAARFVAVPQNSFSDEKLMVEQTLPISGKNRWRGAAAGAEAGGVLAQWQRRKWEVITRARTAYFELANDYKQIELNRKNSALLRQFARTSGAKLASDERSQSDVLGADTEAAKLDEAQVDLERAVAVAQTELNTLMNRPPETALGRPVEAELRPLDFSLAELEGLALAHRPELALAARTVEAAQARLKAAHQEWVPEPSLRVEADRYNGASQVVSELDAGFSIDLPWFNRSKYRAGIQENARLLEAAQHELEAARSEALGLVVDQFHAVEAYHHHTELYRVKLLPLARENAKARQIGYESNKADFLEILTAQQTVQDLESMYWDHLAHYQIAVAELESIIGVDLAQVTPAPSVPAHLNSH